MVAKILATKFGFVLDCWDSEILAAIFSRPQCLNDFFICTVLKLMELAGIKHIRGSDKYKEYLEQELLQLRKNGVALRVLPKKVSENEGTDTYMYGCLIANVSTLYQCKKFGRCNLQVQHTSYFLNLVISACSRHREIHRSSVFDRWKQWRTDENPYCAGPPVR